MAITAASLTLLPTTAASTDLVSIINGKGSGAASPNPIDALKIALKTEARAIAAVAAETDTKRDIKAFQLAVSSAKTPAELLANPVARKVLLTANGLGDQTSYTALATKALLSDTGKAGSLASKLADTRWLGVAKTFDFANKGLAALKDPKVLQSLTDGYAEVTWRQRLDKATPGLSNALDFRARASTATSVDQLLGDKTFRTVVTVALGIPPQIAFQPLSTQENAIASKLDVTKLQTPAFVDQLTKRYLIAAGSAAAATGQAKGVASLFV